MGDPAYTVTSYSIDTLKTFLVEKTRAELSVVEAKLHTVFFEEYFAALNAKTIVVENKYVDRDYLEDFAAYYVRCFPEYRRFCTRLHFFKEAFNEEEFASVISGKPKRIDARTLQNAYSGFVVLKPLPQTVIGRTCLESYPSNGTRSYPVLRDYDAHLFGLKLPIRSLAFQEQDSVVAACATSALWSVFQQTGKLFHHSIPSPVDITRIATDHSPSETRNLPNAGLTGAEMARAIRSVGLEPYQVRATEPYVLRGNVYGYVRGSVPLILGVVLYKKAGKAFERIGRHAVAVTGYSLGSVSAKPFKGLPFRLRALRIDKIYVHDDQVGPFARMKFDAGEVKDRGATLPAMGTSWGVTSGATVLAVPDLLVAPVYHKIRIPFDSVLDHVKKFHAIVLAAVQAIGGAAADAEWDIYLSSASAIKESWLQKNNLDPSAKHALLTRGLPKYVWSANLTLADKPLADVIFDATDIEQGSLVAAVVEHKAAFVDALRKWSKIVISKPAVAAQLRPFGWPLLKFFSA
jgi:hypothetical protein